MKIDVKRPSHKAHLKRWQDAVIPGAEIAWGCWILKKSYN